VGGGGKGFPNRPTLAGFITLSLKGGGFKRKKGEEVSLQAVTMVWAGKRVVFGHARATKFEHRAGPTRQQGGGGRDVQIFC